MSLYAATGLYDDFAETYAMYVHVVIQERPWALSVTRRGEVVMSMDRPILQNRCDEKRAFLSGLLGNGAREM